MGWMASLPTNVKKAGWEIDDINYQRLSLTEEYNRLIVKEKERGKGERGK